MLRTLPNTTFYRPRADDKREEGPPLSPLVGIAEPRAKRILSFDIENRPLSYWYDGNCTAEVTAIAWGWQVSPAADPVIRCRALGDYEFEQQEENRFGAELRPVGGAEMLTAFVHAYNEADIVSGHYIRKHDLPIINGALVEHGMAPLRPKLTSDTRLDLVRWKDLPASQEALGDMLGLDSPKEHMSQAKWREANRLTPEGIAETRRRVIGDVRQHLELRAALLERGLLRAPRMWRP